MVHRSARRARRRNSRGRARFDGHGARRTRWPSGDAAVKPRGPAGEVHRVARGGSPNVTTAPVLLPRSAPARHQSFPGAPQRGAGACGGVAASPKHHRDERRGSRRGRPRHVTPAASHDIQEFSARNSVSAMYQGMDPRQRRSSPPVPRILAAWRAMIHSLPHGSMGPSSPLVPRKFPDFGRS
jgi:hypothetical protein